MVPQDGGGSCWKRDWGRGAHGVLNQGLSWGSPQGGGALINSGEVSGHGGAFPGQGGPAVKQKGLCSLAEVCIKMGGLCQAVGPCRIWGERGSPFGRTGTVRAGVGGLRQAGGAVPYLGGRGGSTASDTQCPG